MRRGPAGAAGGPPAGPARPVIQGREGLSERSPDNARNGREPARSGVYRVLARKYRPRRFEELVGQDAMVRTLTNAFETGRIAQGFMLTGVRGVGKTTTARLIARALNYSLSDRPTVKMEETGEHCEAILESRHVDVIEMDAASHTGVENMREIIEQVRYRPVTARYKVYIIDEVHMLSRAAFNALLKTLEEPPEHVKFVFATTEIRKVPVTVLSRCQRFDLRRVDAALLMKHLARVCEGEKVEAEEEALRLIARAAEGSVRDGLSLLDQAMAYGQDKVRKEDVSAMLGLVDRARIIDLFEALMRGDLSAALEGLAEHHDLGAEPLTVLADLAAFTHLLARLRILGEAGADAAVSEDERRRGLELAGRIPMPALTRAWQMLLKGMSEVSAASRPLPAAEMVLIRLAHAADLPSPADLVRRLEEDAGASSPSAAGAAPTPPAGTPTGTPAPPRAARMPSAPEASAPPPPPEPSPSPAPEEDDDEDEVAFQPENFAEIVALAEEMRDLKAKVALERWVRPVRVAPGLLEVALTEDAPPSLPGDLARRLMAWTGQRWLVTLSDEPGGETIAERERALRDSLFARAEAHPDVLTVLEQFRQASIVDVRAPVARGAGEDAGDDEDAGE